MCSYFQHRMENHQGDLTDVVRAAGGGSLSKPTTNWQFPLDPVISPSGLEELLPADFGNPFSNMRDPILQEVDLASSGSLNIISFEDSASFGCGGGFLSDKIKLPVQPWDMPSPPRGITASPVLPNSTIGSNTTKTCLVPSTDFQISSPPNTGAKRRKNQAKKVVCVPAPAPAPAPAPVPANNRPGGEMVPSDLWAWRKYGQKPIKGSPYPRGYYRCSSSKGCSARKQVERSRTDPSMLVITYTSEHNHPWPTQRNALAGSTRSHPAKSNAASKNSQGSEGTGCTKEEEKESNNDSMSCSPSIITGSSTTNMKEEMEELEAQMDMDDEGGFSGGFDPLFEGHANHLQREDFFADLGKLLEVEPVNLSFVQQGLSADGERENKSLDPSNIYGGWKSSNYTAFGDQPGTGRGL